MVPQGMLDNSQSAQVWLARALVIVSILIVASVALSAPTIQHGRTDFLSFYAGAKLIGSPNLYSPTHVYSIQKTQVFTNQVRVYIRPPFYAAILSPLGRLPYPTAHHIWQVINVLAFALFVVLWCRTVFEVLACCWFFPIWVNYTLGQDLPLVLAAIAGCGALLESRRPRLAGAILALCAIKFHFFLLVPLLVFARKNWQLGWGWLSGTSLLVAVSFGCAGWRWPADYLQLLRDNETAENSYVKMSNLVGLFIGHEFMAGWVLAAALGFVVLVAVFWLFRSLPPRCALAIVPASGVLLSIHAYLVDWCLLLPLLLCSTRSRKHAGLGTTLVPLVGFVSLLLAFPSVSFVPQALLVLTTIGVPMLVLREGKCYPHEGKTAESETRVPGITDADTPSLEDSRCG